MYENIEKIIKYLRECFLKYGTDRKKNIDLKNNSNEEFDRMKNQMNELKCKFPTHSISPKC